mmetsp:Transcript_1184/g.2544  ORF Transcript_1184/g.2544 Transcript_1184/m.2544 type:complete len:205 (-) Transcript_1184:213-827(-)
MFGGEFGGRSALSPAWQRRRCPFWLAAGVLLRPLDTQLLLPPLLRRLRALPEAPPLKLAIPLLGLEPSLRRGRPNLEEGVLLQPRVREAAQGPVLARGGPYRRAPARHGRVVRESSSAVILARPLLLLRFEPTRRGLPPRCPVGQIQGVLVRVSCDARVETVDRLRQLAILARLPMIRGLPVPRLQRIDARDALAACSLKKGRP